MEEEKTFENGAVQGAEPIENPAEGAVANNANAVPTESQNEQPSLFPEGEGATSGEATPPTKGETSAEGEQEEGVNEIVKRVLDEYPELAGVIEDLDNGKPLEVALMRNIDIDALKPLEDEESYAEYEEASKARKENKRKADEHRKTYESNQEESKKVLAEFISDNGMDDASAKEFAEKIDNAIADYVDGKVTKEFLTLFRNGLNHAKDIEDAYNNGTIEGKNAKVDATRHKAEQTDGMPQGGSSAGIETEPEEEDDSIFGSIQSVKKRRGL